MFPSLKEKHIIISGATGGIGEACAIALDNCGATLTLLGRDTDKLNVLSGKLTGTNHNRVTLNLKDTDLLENKINEAVQKSGKLNGFVHCAGIEGTFPLKMSKPHLLNDFMDINLKSALEICRIFSLKKNHVINDSSIVLISSIMGSLGQSGKTIYSATKGALIAASKSMALELSPRGIRVNTVSPAMVETELTNRMIHELPLDAVESIKKMHPLGFGKPEDIANITSYLLSDLGKWITGTDLKIDGGYSAS